MKLKWIAAAVACLVVSACATSPTGRKQLMLVSPQQMDQMGVSAFQAMRKKGKFANAPHERAYARCVADALIKVLPPPFSRQTWDVQIIDDKTANAFALPGGRIGVNKGMFKIAKNQNQLATVLGHELSHVVSHHAAERVSDNYAVQGGVLAASLYGASRGNDAGRLMAALGAGAEVGILLPFSRAQEAEADTLGQRYMAEAGFDPRAAVKLWQEMEQQGGSKPPVFLSTHPSPAQRIQSLQKQAQRLLPVYKRARANGHKPNCHL